MTLSLEVIRTVAILCAASGSTDRQQVVDQLQLNCQQYYLQCIDQDHINQTIEAKILDCVKFRKIDK